MKSDELFEIWAPSDLVMRDGGPAWSCWAKPVIFAAAQWPGAPALDAPSPAPDVTGVPSPREGAAVIVNLPGVDAVMMGLELASRAHAG